jgi:hypothetical protein
MQCFSKVSACRRVLNSHDAASRDKPSGNKVKRGPRSPAAEKFSSRDGEQHAQERTRAQEPAANDLEPRCQARVPHGVGAIINQSARRATATSRCASSPSAERWHESVVVHGPQRGAGKNWSTPTSAATSPHPACRALHRASRPNPSLKLSPNGGPPGPGCGYRVHSPQPGPGVPPSVPT